MDTTPWLASLYSLIPGTIGGITGVVLSHPADTLRVKIQTDKSYKNVWDAFIKTYKEGGIKAYYRGIYAPLFGVGLEKTIVFGVYNYVYKHIENHFIAGCFAGLACSVAVAPIERIKINLQNDKINEYKNTLDCLKKTIKLSGVKGLFNGLTATFTRETPGFGIYFSSYHYLVNEPKPSYGKVFLCGTIAGSLAWVFIYPQDKIKSIMQMNGNKEIKFIECCKKVFREGGMRGMYKGFSLALLRAAPLHGGVFLGYQIATELL